MIMLELQNILSLITMIHNTDAMEQMKNPLSQFKDEEPAWIPYDTLLAMMDCHISEWT